LRHSNDTGQNPQLIVGAVGKIGSGKDALIQYLNQRCGAYVASEGDVARDLATKENLDPTRDNLHQISEKYMDRFGDDFFAVRIMEHIEAARPALVGVTGVRRPTDVQAFKSRFPDRFLLVHVDAGDVRTRFERSRERDTDRDTGDFETFRSKDAEEIRRFEIERTIDLADLTIDNRDSLSDFHQQVEDALIAPILRPRGLCRVWPEQS
jgi:dephospho-CoA kinase